jgi:hypothetical protein
MVPCVCGSWPYLHENGAHCPFCGISDPNKDPGRCKLSRIIAWNEYIKKQPIKEKTK